MKYLIALSAVLAIVACRPGNEHFVHVHQDNNGNYKVSFDTGDFYKTEEGSNGEVLGTYSYIDSDGKLQTVKYSAGIKGFIADGTNFPKPVVELPEVMQARSEHLKLYEEVLKYLPITEEFDQSSKGAKSFVFNNVPTASKGGLVPVVKYVPYEIPVQY